MTDVSASQDTKDFCQSLESVTPLVFISSFSDRTLSLWSSCPQLTLAETCFTSAGPPPLLQLQEGVLTDFPGD